MHGQTKEERTVPGERDRGSETRSCVVVRDGADPFVRRSFGNGIIAIMYAVATFLVVAVLTLAFTRIATGALIATGVPPEIAGFQARSAFSGAGFTTTEAENVVNHPVRRRIIGMTMFVGNLGTPTLVVSVMLGFIAPGPGSTVERAMVTFAGLLFVVLLLVNRPVQKLLVRVGHRYASERLIPYLQEGFREIAAVGDDYVVGAIEVIGEPGATYRSLRALDQSFLDLRVLGVRSNDRFAMEVPADVDLSVGDEIVVFGRRDDVERHVGGGRV